MSVHATARRRPGTSNPSNQLVSASLAVLLLLGFVPALSLIAPQQAQATYASGGTGIYKGDIDWLEWRANGTAPDVVTNGAQAITTKNVGGEVLSTVCTINGIAGTVPSAEPPLKVYRSGTWENDGLDELYNIGGTGTANRLASGLRNVTHTDTVRFNFSCSATLDGAPMALAGLVVADAEASNAPEGEFIEAQPTPGTAAWRIIERQRSCSEGVTANLNSTGALRLSPTGGECLKGSGPMAIAYMEGATSAAVTLKGGGRSAVALGVVLATDFGDAPATYGSAGALYQPKWTGTPLLPGSSNVWSLILPTQAGPGTRLGASIDSDAAYVPSPLANVDDRVKASPQDTANLDDEDAVTNLGTINALPGQPYTLPNVQCAGPGHVAGWMDWNANGAFDTGERSAPVQCTGAAGAAPVSVSLTWTVPADVKKTSTAASGFLRLRITADAAELNSPLGMTTTGEVEDHALRINVPTLGVQKNLSGRAAASDQFILALSNPAGVMGTAATTGAATGIQTAQISPVTAVPGTTYTFTEAMTAGSASPAANYSSTSQCTAAYPNGTTRTLPAQTGTSGTVTVPAYEAAAGPPAISCVFTNTPQPASITANKTWIVNGERFAQGSQPAGLSAYPALTLGGTTKRPAWGTAETGYAAGNQVAVSETTEISASMPGCTLTGQRATAANGTAMDADLSSGRTYTLALAPGANTVAITNTVACATTLTLNKEVSGGGADPGAWTLAAVPAAGPPALSGATGVTGPVSPGTVLALAESAGPAQYVQDDDRSAAERRAAPLATGSWTCRALNAAGDPVSGVVTGRMGTDGTVTAVLGSRIDCTAVNRTAGLSILKQVENVNGTGTATASDWNLTAAPASGVDGLEPTTVTGAETIDANTFRVRPGHRYQLSESSDLGGYRQAGLQRFTGADPRNAGQLANPANWQDVDPRAAVSVSADTLAVYRFVNRDVAAFALPLTGGAGALPYLLGGGLILLLAAGTALLLKRRTTVQRT